MPIACPRPRPFSSHHHHRRRPLASLVIGRYGTTTFLMPPYRVLHTDLMAGDAAKVKVRPYLGLYLGPYLAPI